MDDNNSSDDEFRESPASPKSGGKKLKLNDGSSQDSFKETVSNSKDENIDSGVSADKSESTSSEGHSAGTSEGPSNELVNAAPSTSNIHTILLNIRRPKRNRNYRKRKTPERDTDSNDTSQDSDDLSSEDTPQPARQNENSNSETESDDQPRYMDLCATESDSSNSGSQNSPDSHTFEDSDEMIQLNSGDTDSDEDVPWSRLNDDNDENEESEENRQKTPSVLLKAKPEHNYVILQEIIKREMGITFPCGKTTKTDVIFEQNFYGSLHAVYRLEKLHQLQKHRGCVNSINFHPEGRLLASGSDDTNVVIWDWARKKVIQTIKTGHKSNVFQSKFLHLNSRSQLNIVTCARDGQVRLVQCPSSGGGATRRRLMGHSRAAHKLHVSGAEPHRVLSAGEDGLVLHCDLRHDNVNRLVSVKECGRAVPLYSVDAHPLEPRVLLLAGRDRFVRAYDTRRAASPLALYCPAAFTSRNGSDSKRAKLSMMHLTCAVYSHDGSEILGTYNDDDVYLFDAKNDVYDKDSTSASEGYSKRYSGHRNSATYKGVSFFGPGSEYVVSGSDCAHIYVWDKSSEAIVQWLHGDANGVVNCIEPHPRFPVLATSGLDKDVKIWAPYARADPKYEGLEKVVRENSESRRRSPLFNDFLPTVYNAWRSENQMYADGDMSSPYGGNIEFDGNVCTAF
ncbi:DDB1- and CUL4-associated factor 8 [Bombyx mori]|uniref:DDB1- and CUL4-associated factor 8 n=1 Tax=Bombyx mori TaxID=7091 RepID=A0A8R2GB61_BOMMO|nr:DDB1- and CUL4-associated factor 8 [Bombyx mori]